MTGSSEAIEGSGVGFLLERMQVHWGGLRVDAVGGGLSVDRVGGTQCGWSGGELSVDGVGWGDSVWLSAVPLTMNSATGVN